MNLHILKFKTFYCQNNRLKSFADLLQNMYESLTIHWMKYGQLNTFIFERNMSMKANCKC